MFGTVDEDHDGDEEEVVDNALGLAAGCCFVLTGFGLQSFNGITGFLEGFTFMPVNVFEPGRC